jgi:hypothetical protein
LSNPLQSEIAPVINILIITYLINFAIKIQGLCLSKLYAEESATPDIVLLLRLSGSDGFLGLYCRETNRKLTGSYYET